MEEARSCYPACLMCEKGVMVPLSDYGKQGSELRYKAWACTNPYCGFHIRVDNGEISFSRTRGTLLKGEETI